VRVSRGIGVALAVALAACGQKKAANEQELQPANTSQVLKGNEAGLTPMKDRVAIIGFLNKRNGIVHNLRMKPGQAVRAGDAIIRLRACETTAPWEQEKLTGAFLQLDVQGADKKWRRVFSGWVYRESPSLNVVQHPVYDVWPKSCAMTFPPGPPPPPGAAPSSPGNESSAQKSAGGRAAPAEEAPAPSPAPEAPSPSALANNAM
jgi:hypothetical protein